MKWSLEKCIEPFNNHYYDFVDYLAYMYDRWEISEEEYTCIRRTIEAWNIKKVFKVGVYIKVFSNICFYWWACILTLLPQKSWELLYVFLILERVLRLWYSYHFAKKNDIKHHTYYSLFASLPAGEYIAGAIWLKDDTEAVKNYIPYIKDKTQMLLAKPMSQAIMRIIY